MVAQDPFVVHPRARFALTTIAVLGCVCAALGCRSSNAGAGARWLAMMPRSRSVAVGPRHAGGVRPSDAPAATASPGHGVDLLDGHDRAASDVGWLPAIMPLSGPASAPDVSAAEPLSLATRPRDGAGFRVALDVAYLYGEASGFVQTPSGGAPGTTSPRRPRLGEVGADVVNALDVNLTLGFATRHEVYVGAQFVGLSGDHTLADTLISHGETFPAGTRVSADVRLDWYRLGYRYRWVLDRGAGRDPVLTLTPSVGAALLEFDYKLRSDAVRTSRSYGKGLPQVGLELEWRPGGGALSFSVAAMGFPQFESVPAIATERALVAYSFVRGGDGGVDVRGFVGVQFEQFRYEDAQRVPNRIEVDLGPLLVVGLSASF
jgi:hypothetical protein